MPTYQPNIPTGSVPFNEDYLNLQANFQQLNIAYGVDHVPFSDTSGVPPAGQSGLHTVVHLQANSTIAGNPPNNYPITPPTAVSLTGEIFSTQSNDGINPDEILWYQTGGGRLMQLTRNFVPVASTNGYTFIPGGLILQWGTKATTGTGTTVNFNTPFPSNCFVVLLTPALVTLNTNQQFGVASKNLSSFIIIANAGYPVGTTFYWQAIGN